MTEVWDFSGLINSWEKPREESETEAKTEEDKIAEIEEKMKNEINEISNQMVLAKSNDRSVLIDLDLLVAPLKDEDSEPIYQNENHQQLQPLQHSPQQQSVQVVNIVKTPPQQKIIQPQIASKTNKTRSSLTTTNKNNASKLPTLNKSSLSPLPKVKDPFLTRTRNVKAAKQTIKPEKIFKATPDELKVVNFTLLEEYTLTFKLQNVSNHSCAFHVVWPNEPAFKCRIVENVSGTGVKPGLSVTIEIKFKPKEPRDYEGSILISPAANEPPTAVSIRCYRDPPQLVLNDIVDLQSTLVYSSITGSFTITNKGGIAFFSLSSPHGKEESMSYIDGPFTLTPSQFELDNNESINISVKFRPLTEGKHSASFVINAQHFPQCFYFITQGLAAVPRLIFDICDDDRLFLPFLPEDVNTTKSIKIYNDTDVSYPFHIQLIRPRESTKSELKKLYAEIDNKTIKAPVPFNVSPLSGLVGARETFKLNITFSPKAFAFYRSNLVLFANRIPDEAGVLGSRKMLTIAIEGTTGPPLVSIQPPLVLFNNVIPRTPCTQLIEICNDSFVNVKLQWRKSDVITPAPVVFDVKSHQRFPVDLTCLINQRLSTMVSRTSSIFKHNPKIAQEFINQMELREFNYSKSPVKQPSSQHYTITFNQLSKRLNSQQKDDKTTVFIDNVNNNSPFSTINNIINTGSTNNIDFNMGNEEEMPNIFAIRKTLSYVDNTPDVSTGFSNLGSFDNIAHVTDEVSVQIESYSQMNFTYSAHISPPNLIIEPPILDFGCVLAETKAIQYLHLTNTEQCPIGYSIIFSQKNELEIEDTKGVVIDEKAIPIKIQFNTHTAFYDIITIKTWWVDNDGKKLTSLPINIFDIPVYAAFDKPIISIQDRIIDMGDVYPKVKRSSAILVKLLNSFPTDVSFEQYTNTISISSNPSMISNNILLKNKKPPEVGVRSQSTNATLHSNSPPVQNKRAASSNDKKSHKYLSDQEKNFENQESLNDINDEDSINVQPFTEYAISEPQNGHLEPNEELSFTITSCFYNLGKRAIPFKCNILGGSLTCAIVANVRPPKIVLQTEQVDFSSDFVICHKSIANVKVTNDCGVDSSVHLEIVDDCNGVFSIEDPDVKPIEANQTITIPVSCYSEIHGDYNGMLKLIVNDEWQNTETLIPMHVKALGSYFGFQKHTLGYNQSVDGDYISFGEKIKLNSSKVIRRLTLENFSSESITVDWTISNFVKGRHYVNVDLDMNEDGTVSLNITPTPDASLEDPFKLSTTQSIIESHGKANIIIEFTPKEVGTFKGCVSARSGEFLHTLDLYAVCV